MLMLLIALGAFLASSDSADSEVECFTDVDTEQEPMTMPGCKSNRHAVHTGKLISLSSQY